MANLFRKAPEVKALADELIQDNDEFSHLRGVGMIYLFSSDAPTVQGRVSWGKATKLSGTKALYARGMMPSYSEASVVGMVNPTDYECFEILIPKPIWDAMDGKWSQWLIRHHLRHCIITPDEKLGIAGHDIELFYADVDGIDELGLTPKEFREKFQALELAAASYDSAKAGDNGETNKPDKKSDKACKETVPMLFDADPMCIICGDLPPVLPPGDPLHCEGCSPLTEEEREELWTAYKSVAVEHSLSPELSEAIRNSSFETDLPEAVVKPSLCSVCFDLPAAFPPEGPLFCNDCRPLKEDDVNEAVAEREYERQMEATEQVSPVCCICEKAVALYPASNPEFCLECDPLDGKENPVDKGDDWESETPDYLLATRKAEGAGSGKDAEVAE